MKKQSIVVECPHDQPGVYHIPGVHNMQNTLCGFVDVYHEMHFYFDHPCNCGVCKEAWGKIKAMKFPTGYFKEAESENG